MRVLVDTSVWSLALRRRDADLAANERRLRDGLAELIADDRAAIIGPIRQEVLSGVRTATAFERLLAALGAFDDEPLVTADFEEAAQAHNRCRQAGVAGSAVDFLICAAARRRGLAIFTTDRDFERYARVLPLRLHHPDTGAR